MFKIFLKKKLHSGAYDRAKPTKLPENRRLFPRFAIESHHLTAMNEQDILVIREISAKGFSSVVAPRASERFTVGDVYAARMRYLGELYDLDVKVTWKEDASVGFELVNASAETLRFMRRLLKPIEVAASLREVDSGFIRDGEQGKVWYHGDAEADLFIWKDLTNRIEAWQFRFAEDFTEWHVTGGLKTGTIRHPGEKSPLALPQKKAAVTFIHDRTPKAARRQFTTDVFMALPSPLKDELLDTFTR